MELQTVNSAIHKAVASPMGESDVAPATASCCKRPSWAQTEGTPLPLGATWIEDEQAFNFAVHAEHAESVTLLLFSPNDFANPVLAFHFDFLATSQGGSGTAGFRSIKCAVLVITVTLSRGRTFLSFTGFMPTRYCSI